MSDERTDAVRQAGTRITAALEHACSVIELHRVYTINAIGNVVLSLFFILLTQAMLVGVLIYSLSKIRVALETLAGIR